MRIFESNDENDRDESDSPWTDDEQESIDDNDWDK